MNYYNENDPGKAEWLRQLIKRDVIAPGRVDERSILEVEPGDLSRYTQLHFFAGIGAWSYALRLAGWKDEWPCWTGSCPCQPFSVAGQGKGTMDERHLWPAWFNLITKCRPGVVFGEQVADGDGITWLDAVQTDTESAGYRFGACVLPAAGFGAPHGRHRTFFVADSKGRDGKVSICRPESGKISESGGRSGLGGVADTISNGAQRTGREKLVTDAGCETCDMADTESQHDRRGKQRQRRRFESSNRRGTCVVGDTTKSRRTRGDGTSIAEQGFGQGSIAGELEHPTRDRRQQRGTESGGGSVASGRGSGELADADGGDTCTEGLQRSGEHRQQPENRGPCNGFWSDAQWLPCTDGKARAVESGTFPLAHGAPARVLRLRGYGDGIVAEVAAEFVKAYLFLK